MTAAIAAGRLFLSLEVPMPCCETPLGLDEYFPVPEDNPLTQEKIALGRRLFFDRRLSLDHSLACASCHHPHHAFSDTLAFSLGIYGQRTRRNAPALINRAYGRSFMWDGRLETLEEQVLHPVQDPVEMALALEEMVRRLRQEETYVRHFQEAFSESISAANTARALSSFIRALRSGNAAFDRFQYGEREALSAGAQRGLALFRGKGNCTACHAGPNLTDEQFHNTGVSWDGGDAGRYEVTGQKEDRGRFKTPTLREVSRTGPYMHDGSLLTLEAVVDFYDRGGHPNPNLDEEIRPLQLSQEEKRALLSFLRSLCGDDPGFSSPPAEPC